MRLRPLQSGVAGHHGYARNLTLLDVHVSAVFSFFRIAVSNFIQPFTFCIPRGHVIARDLSRALFVHLQQSSLR